MISAIILHHFFAETFIPYRGGDKMNIFQNIINHKINHLTTEELLKYAKQFQISLSRKEAAQIADYLKGKNVNIFNDEERSKLIKELARITNGHTAKEVNRLLLSFTK